MTDPDGIYHPGKPAGAALMIGCKTLRAYMECG
jgi:hypothetical protein